VLLAGIATILVAILHPTSAGKYVSSIWYELFPASDDRFKYSGTAFIALLLGLAAAKTINFVVDLRKGLNKVATFAADQAGDYMLRFVFKAIENRKFITVLMSSRAAYLGYVSVSPTLKAEGQLVLTLAAEGFLQKDSLKLNWTTQYVEWLEDAQKATDYMIAIPTRSIENVHFFQVDVDSSRGSEAGEESN
jgi:hypothetical protein